MTRRDCRSRFAARHSRGGTGQPETLRIGNPPTRRPEPRRVWLARMDAATAWITDAFWLLALLVLALNLLTR